MNNKSKKEILCTLGPASLNDRVIARLTDLGVSLFRINLSHTDLKDLKRIISYIQSRTATPICLDTEGAQIRTGRLIRGKITLKENDIVSIEQKIILGNEKKFNLYPADIISQIKTGDLISIDFNAESINPVSSFSNSSFMFLISSVLSLVILKFLTILSIKSFLNA